jgi:putative addiction module component (TIGR02574 family)
MTRDALLQEALKLPYSERADVAAELLASLDEEPAESLEEVERAWAAEIERRARRVLSGASSGAPWPEVKSGTGSSGDHSLTRSVTAADLDSQRQTFEELTRRYPPEEAEAALRELLAGRKP